MDTGTITLFLSVQCTALAAALEDYEFVWTDLRMSYMSDVRQEGVVTTWSPRCRF